MSEQIHHDQDAEVLLDTLLGELQDVGLITWSSEGRITSLSERCRELMQLPVATAVGGPIGMLGQSPCREFMKAYEGFRASGSLEPLEQEIELSRDGGTYWLKLSLKKCPKECGGKSAYLMIVRDISLQRRSLEQAQQTQGFFEAALRAIPDAAVFTDSEGKLTKVSAGAERIFGYREEELAGRSIDLLASGLKWQEIPQGEDGSALKPVFQMVEAVGKEGRRFSTEVVTDWILDEQGGVLGTVAILRDVSERLAMQEDMLKQTLLLDSIFRQLPFALSVVDTDYQIVQMSDAALSLFGYQQEQMANNSLSMIFPSGEEIKNLTGAISGEKPGESVVSELVDAKDRRFWGRIQAAPLFGSERTLRGYLMAFEDVTERIAYEEELRRYEEIVSASSDALIFIDKRHIYRAANEAYLKLWNKTKQQVIGSHISDVVGEEFYLMYSRPALKQCFSGNPITLDALELDYPTGRRYIDARHTPYRNELGEITGVLITLRDVTKRHLAERSMYESQQRFRQAGEFAEFAVWEVDLKELRPIDDSLLRHLLGYSEEDPLDTLDDWIALIAEPDRQRMIEQYKTILVGTEPVQSVECRVTKKSGELVYIETSMEVKWQDDQRRLLGISRDITSLVKERKDLRRHEHMTMAAQDGLALVDHEHVYRAVNRFYTRQYGYEPEEIVGKPVAWLWGDELYQEVVKPMFERCFAGQDGHHQRWQDYPVAGRRRVEISFSPYRNEAGEITRVLVTTHDVTDSYLSQQAMQESEEKFRAIFHHTPIGVVIMDLEDGRILDANPASLSMHGYEREEYLALKPWDLVVGITPQNFAPEWQRVTERLRSRFETRLRRKDGSTLNGLVDASRMQLKGHPVIISTLVDISKQKQLELRLREQQGQYRMLVESSNAILFAAQPQTFRFSFVSHEAEKLLGYPVSEWLGNTDFWQEHLHPEDRIWAPTFCHSMVDQREAHDFDYRMIAADGRTVWLHNTTSVIVENDRVVSLVGVMVDITAIKEAEAERLRLSEMVQQSADAILLTDTDFYITYINEAFTRLYGYVLAELKGKRPAVLLGEEHAGTILLEIYSNLEAGRRVEHQLLGRRKDGDLFHCHYSFTPLRNDQGDVIAFMSSQRDVTKRVQAEQALRNSEEKYRQIVETAQEGIWVIDAEARTTFVNPRMAEMLDYMPNEMSGVPLFEFMDDANRKLARELWQSLPMESYHAREICYQRRDGTNLWCYISMTSLLDSEGEFIGALALLTDISEQRQLTEALIRSQKMEAVGQLTGGISHDFNNILGSILGFTELAQSRLDTEDSKIHDYLAQIATAGGRARDLVRQLLVFSRGENTQSASSILLSPMVEEVIKMLRPMLPVSIEIRSELPQPSPSVKVDPLHIQQVLMNLCINARDAIGESGLIIVEVRRLSIDNKRCAICGGLVNGDWIAIRVSDTGRGIDEALREDMFQPFVTSKDVGEGSGMGLAVVGGIVSSYHGHLLVESVSGQGASFEILLQESLAESAAAGKMAEIDVSSPLLEGLSILAVDDEPQFRHYFKELLSDAGAEVISCRSGVQALGRYQRDKQDIDLIITDQAMPGMSGSEMVRCLRGLGCQAPAILCSGYGYEVHKEQMEVLKIVSRLRKPVARSEIFTAIHQALTD